MAGGLVALIAAVLIGSVSIPAPHDGGDNATYLSLAHSLVSGTGYTEVWDPGAPPHTKYPPVFPLALAALMLVGVSTWAGFKVFMALGVGTATLFAFGWATRRSGAVAGAAVAVLALLSGGWLQASRWILSEPLFLVLTFVALWAAERGLGPSSPARPNQKGREGGQSGDLDAARWTALAGASAILALFTRSAGLPLVLAILGALVLAKRLRAATVFGACLIVPGALWFLRARQGGQGAYQSEFWMVDPYQPALGNVGWLDLPVRAWGNLRTYVGTVLPEEWWPAVPAGARVALGIVLVALAAWGWFARMRVRREAAELFVPLYVGLILVWPEAWAGDRFILPLYPLGLLYAGETLHGARRWIGGPAAFAVVAVGVLALAAPAVPGWLVLAEEGSTCRQISESADPVQCHRAGVLEFKNAAEWAGANLPQGAVVLNRKPSLYYVFGGQPGRIFPFSVDPGPLLAEADRIGARYLLVDHVDGISPFYLSAAIQAYPGAFCHVAGWGGTAGLLGTDLFGIRPPEERLPGTSMEQLTACPEGYRVLPMVEPPPPGAAIPRLVLGRAGDSASAEGSAPAQDSAPVESSPASP